VTNPDWDHRMKTQALAPKPVLPRVLVSPESAAEDLRNAVAILTLAVADAQGQVVLSRAEYEAILGRLERAYRKLERGG
jgi:hypothetical protein